MERARAPSSATTWSPGLTRPGTLALVATAEPDFERHVVAPLLAGYTKNGTCHKVEQEEAPVARAMLLHMWLEARKDWKETLLPSPAAAPVATHSVAAQPAPADDKPPKTFPQWAKQIEAYNSKLLGAKRRRFPGMQLAGAEQILAKLWHMHTRTKQYEPPGLGEVIQARTFTASGDVNPLREKKHASKGLRIEDDTLVPKEDPQWEPRSVLSVLDGLEATKWALILCEWGEEEHIAEYMSWFMAKARSKPAGVEQIRQYWLTAGWRICMGMRSGRTFHEMAQEVMADHGALAEALATPARPQPNKAGPAPASLARRRQPTPERRADGKGSKKGRPQRQQWRTSPWEQSRPSAWPQSRWRDNDFYEDRSHSHSSYARQRHDTQQHSRWEDQHKEHS